MTFALTKYLQKSSFHTEIFPFTVRNKLRGDTVVETKATLKVVRTGVKLVLIYS